MKEEITKQELIKEIITLKQMLWAIVRTIGGKVEIKRDSMVLSSSETAHISITDSPERFSVIIEAYFISEKSKNKLMED